MSETCFCASRSRRFGNSIEFVAIAVIVATGCAKPPVDSPSGASASAQIATTVDIDEAETWDVVRMSGQPIGYQVTRWKRRKEDGTELREVSAESRLKLRRFGQVTEESMEIVSRDSLDGNLLSFSTRVSAGNNPILTTGRFTDGQLHLETNAGGATQKWSIRPPHDCGGLFAVETSLLREPMKPNERRRLTALIPVLNIVAKIELTALGLEEAQLLDGSRPLQHIVSQTMLGPGQSLRTDLWCDGNGQVVKSSSPAMQQEVFRVNQQQALQEIPGDFDLGDASIVRVEHALPSPHETRRIRYRATLADEDPASVFATRPYQRVTPIDEHSADITVTAVGPDVTDATATESPPEDRDRLPSALIQSHDPLIVELASQLAPDDGDPWSMAIAIERFVHEYVTEKNFSTAFASAADVARNKAGDCTEHAVLTAAICRASGMPARLVVGLVYVPSRSGFGFHMWNEVWIDGHWIPIDATIGRGGIGADHLVLSTTSLDAQESFSSFLPVIQTIGRLSLRLQEVDSME